MSFGSSSGASGPRSSKIEYGRTHVVRPKGAHKATIVWLHGLGDNGSSWAQLLGSLPLPNIKWICPTAPLRPVTVFGGFPSTAWFDVSDLEENSPLVDAEGMDSAAAHVANLLSTEPADVKLGVCGFSMGAATTLYSVTCFADGKYVNGNPYPVNLSVAIALSGWLPNAGNFRIRLKNSQGAQQRASNLPVLLCHGTGDEVVPYEFGEKSASVMKSHGFANLTFRPFEEMRHHTIPIEMEEVTRWLTAQLGLGASES